MKCNKCNGYGYIDNLEGDGFKCPKCNGIGEYEPFDTDVELDKLYPTEQTNDEWRKNCSIKEFAEFLSNLSYACMRCGISNGEAYCYIGYCIQDKEDALRWLKQPHYNEAENEI